MEFAKRFATWRKRIRGLFPEKFIWVDCGDTVQWSKFGIGVVTDCLYFPVPDRYLIEVSRGSEQLFFTQPSQLQVLKKWESLNAIERGSEVKLRSHSQ